MFSTYFQLDCGSLSTSKEFSVVSLNRNYYLHGSNILLYLQNYKRTCDIFNEYKVYKVKAQESCYSLRERVKLGRRVVSGSDPIPLQYVLRI